MEIIHSPYFKMADNYELYHHGILGMKWGVRRFQNPDGSLTAEGKLRYRYDERKGKYVKLTGKERRAAKKRVKALQKAQAAAAAAKANHSPRDKKINEMTDKQLEKYITRMANEKRALELRKEVQNLDPKPLTKGQKFVQKYVDGLLVPHLKQNGSQYINKLIELASKSDKKPDKYELAKKEADYYNNLNNIDNYRKQIEERQSGNVDKYKEAKKEREYYVDKALALQKKQEYEKLSVDQATFDSIELKRAVASVINDNASSTSWRLDYDEKNGKIK